MIRSIDIHTGDYSSLDTDVVVLSLACSGSISAAFEDLNRQAEIRRAAAHSMRRLVKPNLRGLGKQQSNGEGVG